jgi:hypothetical protein
MFLQRLREHPFEGLEVAVFFKEGQAGDRPIEGMTKITTRCSTRLAGQRLGSTPYLSR